MTKWHVDKLITYIAALTLIVDDFEVDTYDIREDLRLEPTQYGFFYYYLYYFYFSSLSLSILTPLPTSTAPSLRFILPPPHPPPQTRGDF